MSTRIVDPFASLSLQSTEIALRKDRQLRNFCPPSINISFGFRAGQETTSLVVTVQNGAVSLQQAVDSRNVSFTLDAEPQVWNKFFQIKQELGFQSFWAMSVPQNQVTPAVASVTGDKIKFAQYAPVWRRSLELIHTAITGASIPESPQPMTTDDHLIGRYKVLDLPTWGGRCKTYFEQSGEGDQDILFLHTAGSDGRQYHGVMNDPRMLQRGVRMTVVDLPSHGRSFPVENSTPGEHYNSEDRYIEFIAEVIRKLDLRKTIVCGASMAGLICIAVALRYKEVGAYAAIPIQGCEFVDMERVNWDKGSAMIVLRTIYFAYHSNPPQHPEINQSLFVPEFTYGMMSPTAPTTYRDLVWHTYSGQAFGIYAGDLDFYFGGFDYRGKLSDIETKTFPVAMLTGEYDWSCRPDMSIETASKIPGAWIKIMDGLGHFPATENPHRFVAYLLEALDHVQSAAKSQ